MNFVPGYLSLLYFFGMGRFFSLSMHHHPQVFSEYPLALQTRADVPEGMVPQLLHAQLLTLLLQYILRSTSTNSFLTQEWKSHCLSMFAVLFQAWEEDYFFFTNEQSLTLRQTHCQGCENRTLPCSKLTLQSGPAQCSLSSVTTGEFQSFVFQAVVGVYQVSKDDTTCSSL